MKIFRQKYSKRMIDIAPILISIVIGIFLGVIILFLTNPNKAIPAFFRLIKGPFNYGVLAGLGNLLYFSIPILMTGLSVGFAFKTGLFNIGASSQFLAGAFTAILIGAKATFIPSQYLWIFALLGAAIAGAVPAFFVGLFKAVRNVNEVITSIMMNYIVMYTVNYLVKKFGIYNNLRNETVPLKTSVPNFGLDKIFKGSFVSGGIVIAIIMAIIVYIILYKTNFGFELTSVGSNRDAATYAGINEKKSIVYSMIIAGMLAGIGGGLMYLVQTGKHLIIINEIPSEGFDGIAVALLALSNPLATILSAFFISYIRLGGQAMQTLGYVPEIIDMMISIILYVSSISLLFRGFIEKIFIRREANE